MNVAGYIQQAVRMRMAIVEVIGRSKQGQTQPYVCRGDDGAVQIVKGPSATRHGLIAQWLCARPGLRV